MAVFPVEVFTEDKAIIGRNDQYKSSVLGRKFAGQPKGVYQGFIPSVTPPSPILTLGIDPTEGFSCIKLPSDADPAGVDIIIDRNINIDFTGQPPGDFPISVLAQASYTDDATTPTSASIITRTFGLINPGEVLLTVVDGPATSLTVIQRLNHSTPTGGGFQIAEVVTGNTSGATASVLSVGTGFFLAEITSGTFSLGETITGGTSGSTAVFAFLSRAGDVPFALSDVDFGFMPSGSIEALQAATDIVNEVVAARVGLDSTVYADLSARLAADQTAASMAGRLGLVYRALRSNDYSVNAGESAINVSGSFTQIERDHNPLVTLGGTGDETTVGAIAGPDDQQRNVCLVQDANSGYRPLDDPTDRLTVFGRIEGPEVIPISGTWTFTNALTGVVGVDSNATTEINVRDTIIGPDGLFYEIASITNDTTIELRTAYTGTTGSSSGLSLRRWLLRLKKLVGGVETDASLPTPTTIRFFFPAFLTIAQGNYDYSMAMHTAAERDPLPDASETVPGALRLATSPAFLGSVEIQNGGITLGGGPFHTINFNAANASVIPGLSGPGEVEVAEIGQPGAPGNPGPSGGPGNPGPTGPGFSEINTFERSGEFAGAPATPPIPFSFTRDMGHTIRNLEGGIARWRDLGFFAIGLDVVQILDITGIGGTMGTIDGDVAQDTLVTVFLSSSGD